MGLPACHGYERFARRLAPLTTLYHFAGLHGCVKAAPWQWSSDCNTEHHTRNPGLEHHIAPLVSLSQAGTVLTYAPCSSIITHSSVGI
jgi:hypothetical protein